MMMESLAIVIVSNKIIANCDGLYQLMTESFSSLNTAFLISGSGSTVEAVIRACDSGELENINPTVVISNNPDAYGLKRAEALNVPYEVVPRKGISLEQFGDNLLDVLQGYGVDFVSQNGWLCLTPPQIFKEYKVINQHPGKLTGLGEADFGGKGMYGSRVTAATLIYAWLSDQENPYTESTIHYVNQHFDGGLLINVSQLAIPALNSSRPITIADFQTQNALRQYLINATLNVQQSLLPLEHANVINTLRLFGEGQQVKGWHRRPDAIVPAMMTDMLAAAKELGIEMFPKG